MLPLILASGSPRRSALLAQLGINFKVMPSPINEAELKLSGSPEIQVQESARAKGMPVAKSNPGSWVLSADTIVYVEGKILGKPKDSVDALQMLQILQGRSHSVFTGLCLTKVWSEQGLDKMILETAYEETKVWMKEMTAEEIAAYVNTGEPMDKAGAYAIQALGSCLVPRIEGCFFNVMGLPLYKTAELCKKVGIPIWQVKNQ